jgi:catechol 1,2-dioxygenase
MLEHARFAKAGVETTESAILGPFAKEGVPVEKNGSSIVRMKEPGAPVVHLYGKITDADGQPIKGALLDVWEDVRLLSVFLSAARPFSFSSVLF